MAKRYLVTGGCGFIGSHLVDSLLLSGNEVCVLDDLSTGKLENLNRSAKFIKGDIRNYDILSSLINDVDGVFHLAAIASVEKSKNDWYLTNEVNLGATVKIFDLLSKKKRKTPIVYTSSAAIYGTNYNTPLKETEPAAPISAYGADKYSCELSAKILWEVHGVPNFGVRPFNIYGPRQDPNSPYSGVISIFTNKILRGEAISIFGDGEQKRDFVFVGDAVEVFLRAMANISGGSNIANICTGKMTSINKLAETIAKLCGRELVREHKDQRLGDIRVSCGDAANLKKLLGFIPTTNLVDGLKLTINGLVE